MAKLMRVEHSGGTASTGRGIPVNPTSRAQRPPAHQTFPTAGSLTHHVKTARGPVKIHAASPVETAERSTALNGNGNGSHAAANEAGQTGAAVDQELFDWAKAWYPLAIEADLPPDRPTPVRLLGHAIVLWKDGSGAWRAFRDQCPHRLVPLSEGRVENGELMCSYHGWQFRGSDGRATVIPQAPDQKAADAACASRRSCCTVHPCAVQDGLVWVWGSAGPEAEAEAARVPPVNSPKFAEGKSAQVTQWFMRELPYDVEILCENVLDPSHVPFSHHGVQGNRYKPPKLQMAPAEVSHAGVSVPTKPIGDNIPPRMAQGYTLSFGPPTLIRFAFPAGNEMMVHVVPIDPGRSKLIFTLVLPKERLSRKLALLLKVLKSRPLLWYDHFERNEILDGDSVFLACQEQELRARALNGQQPPGTWSKAYYMPTSLDSAVQGFRRWQAECARPIPWAPTARPPPAQPASRRQLLDRWEQHTQHCPSCAGAHRNFSLLRQAGTYAAVIAAAYAALQLGNGQPLRRLLAPALAGLAATGLAVMSNAFLTRLTFKDYRHPEH